MRVAISHILLLSLVVNTFFASGYVVEYYLQIDTYLEQCINKNRPELNCDGKCALAKKITEAQPSSSEKPELLIPTCFEYVYGYFKSDFKRSYSLDKSGFEWVSNYTFNWNKLVFVPPKV